MAVAVILLTVVLMYFTAYIVAIERTLRALGLPPAEESDTRTRSRAQSLIILGIELTRLNAAFLLGVVVYLITARASAWYYGVLIVVLCVIGSTLIGSTSSLRPGSPEMVAAIMIDLERRREWYKKAGDVVRLQAVEDLLARIRSFPRIQRERGVNR
jgi:hypothetical protein